MAEYPTRPGGLRRWSLRLAAAAVLGAALFAVGPVSGLAAEPAIEATGTSLANYAWTPATAEVDSGGSVAFKNPSANPHGLVWESGPEIPNCTGTPTLGQGNWSGSCSFAQGGTYAFHCPVHPVQMKGTVTVKGPAAPVVATGSASAVTEFGATLGGTVNPSGQETTYYFEYGTTTGYGQKTTEAAAGEGTAAVAKSASVGGLFPATTYHFRLVAKNVTGTTLGADRTFSTTGPPSATTGTATGVSESGATLRGTVNPHGFATVYFFNYGPTEAYGAKTPETSAGSGTAAVAASAPLAGLAPGTTYHLQLVAKSSAGTTAGQDLTLVTSSTPPAEPEQPPATVPPSPPPTPPLPTPSVATPDTRITLKPPARGRDRTPTLRFTATVAGATFRCGIDGKALKPCRSPYTTPPLKPGRHTIRVVAQAGGSTDATPASFSFRVLAAKR